MQTRKLLVVFLKGMWNQQGLSKEISMKKVLSWASAREKNRCFEYEYEFYSSFGRESYSDNKMQPVLSFDDRGPTHLRMNLMARYFKKTIVLSNIYELYSRLLFCCPH